MSQINVGIIGYGNLGKAVEEILRTRKEFKIVAIFSKRKFVKSQYEVDRLDNLEKYKDKIDLLFLCAGSYDGVEKIGNEIIKDYSFIDSFDTHSKLYDYISKLDLIAKERETVCLNACGWDPGILSLVRLLFNSISPSYFTANCFFFETESFHKFINNTKFNDISLINWLKRIDENLKVENVEFQKNDKLFENLRDIVIEFFSTISTKLGTTVKSILENSNQNYKIEIRILCQLIFYCFPTILSTM